jgi:hypothetical protein
MAVGTFARADNEETPVGSLYVDVVTFNTTGNYATGGYLSFATSLASAIGAGRTILGIIGLETQGYTLEYAAATDALKVYVSSTGAADTEFTPGALALTGLKILVISK